MLKQHITYYHYRRIPMSQQGPHFSLPYPLPPDVPVAYNAMLGKQPSKSTEKTAVI